MYYCSRCHCALTTQQPDIFLNENGEKHDNTLDWCHRCQDVVETTQCSLPPWTLTATLGLFCWLQNVIS